MGNLLKKLLFLVFSNLLCDKSSASQVLALSRNSNSSSSNVLQVLLNPISFRAYFIQDTIPKDAGFDENTIDLLQNISSTHSTNFTVAELQRQVTHSIEEAVYATLYQKTLLKLSSQKTCRMINWIVSTDCYLFELSPTVIYYDSEYFNELGNTRFQALVHQHTVHSFLANDGLEQLTIALQTVPSFDTLLEIRHDLEAPETVTFVQQFVPKLDARLLYEDKKENRYLDTMKRPIALLFYTSICIFAISCIILFTDVKSSRRNDLLKLHFQSASRAILEKGAYHEEKSMPSQTNDQDSDSFDESTNSSPSNVYGYR